ncbi:MAG: family 10 glycosylhydrolase [Eubacterium sp.]|nr:family 10 glycosylhydrolase [Eubacterium sp.]
MEKNEKRIVIILKKTYLLPLFVMLLCLGLLMGEKTAQAGSLSMRGVWVSVFEFKEIGLTGNKSETTFRANARDLFSKIKANGCNNVFFHVRSHNDAIYESDLVSWSKTFLNGASAPTYDPLKILVEEAHKKGLKFHAWMNPYRISSSKILNPAKESTIEKIAGQAEEIVKNYDVDGIHMDDYFYPTNIKKYAKVAKKKKYKNTNAMIQTVYKAVKEADKSVAFGISPAGNLSYNATIGADVKTWLSEDGYVDYVAPQIYWTNSYLMAGKKVKLFDKVLKSWREINTADRPMYIGLALYRAGTTTVAEDPGWKKRSNNLATMIKKIKAGNTEGYILYDYVSLYRSSAWKEVKNLLGSICKFKLNKKKKTLKVGKSYKLKVLGASPSRAKKNITFKSTKKSVVRVTKKGKVKAIKKGKAKVIAYIGGKRRVCRIRVKG